MVLDGRFSQEYPINAGVHQGSISGPAFFLIYMNDFPDTVICNSAIFNMLFVIDADDTTFYFKGYLHYKTVSFFFTIK